MTDAGVVQLLGHNGVAWTGDGREARQQALLCSIADDDLAWPGLHAPPRDPACSRAAVTGHARIGAVVQQRVERAPAGQSTHQPVEPGIEAVRRPDVDAKVENLEGTVGGAPPVLGKAIHAGPSPDATNDTGAAPRP